MSDAAEKLEEHQSSIEVVDDVTRKVTVTIPEARVSSAYQTALQRVQSTAKLKGFRPGKAPKQMLEKMHGPRLRLEVANDLISSTLQKIIKEMDESVVGSPEIDMSSFDPGKAIEFTANLSIFPKPEIEAPDTFEVTVPERVVSDEAVNKVLDNILSSKSEQIPITDREVAQEKDVIDATVEVLEPGKDEPQTEPLVIQIGVGELPEELDSGIIGMKVGETKEISISHGADSDCADHGKAHTHDFKVTLNSLSEKKMPDLTDDFVKDLQFDGVETALELKADIRKRLEEEQQSMADEDVNTEIMKILLDKNASFMIPDVLINDEVRSLAVQAGKVDPNKVKVDSFDVAPFKEEFAEQAEKRVRMTIIIDRFAEQNELKADAADMEAHIMAVANKHGIPDEEVRKYFMDQSRIMGTFLDVTRDKVLKHAREKAKITYSAPEK